MPEEIERKFLVESLPNNLDQYPQERIYQGYLAIMEDGTEVRLRAKGTRYFETVKSGRGKRRIELEVEITEEQFKALWPGTKGRRIEKVRYEIPHIVGKLQVDVYHTDLEGLVTVEVEFDSEKSSLRFLPLEWFGREVTEDKRYKNQSLALHGMPKEREQEKIG
ncbi:CYTH domain-containing protein [Acidobacteria bacterium AH-259-L09]|nr:CYTH domain-containing protein [Acidobacteria bacterium AH-259-L09]